MSRAPSRSRAPRARPFADAPSSYADASRLALRGGAVSLLVDGGVAGERLRARADVPSLMLTLPGTVRVSARAEEWIVDRANWMVLPARCAATMTLESPTARVVLLELGEVVRARAVEEYARERVDAATLAHVLGAARALPRTTWVDELAHRYVFERGVCHKHASTAARFLETELVKEAYFLTIEGEADRDRAPLTVGRSMIVRRAIDAIDASLDRPLSMRELARRAGASPRTLERAFSRELGLSPAAHLRARRLDEARVLLRSGRHRVGEVAARVGYASLPAFSSAYRARFGHPPSADAGG
ncbi:MAG: helix-turn-helix transcriptional regulator [Sandaracinaceae bacterium]|nr:helix-turn-helix transcriptional regulator [Sandaracinaceae bacterium]